MDCVLVQTTVHVNLDFMDLVVDSSDAMEEPVPTHWHVPFTVLVWDPTGVNVTKDGQGEIVQRQCVLDTLIVLYVLETEDVSNQIFAIVEGVVLDQIVL